MLLRSLQLSRLLSFGPDSEPVELQPLNVLIGPNGSGKSNFIDAIHVLELLRYGLGDAMNGANAQEWLWKGPGERRGTIEAVVSPARLEGIPLRHRLTFRESGFHLQIEDERIEGARPAKGAKKPPLFFGYERGTPTLTTQGKPRRLQQDALDPRSSVLAQRRDPELYPELFALSEAYGAIRVYRDWAFGRGTPARAPQRTDLPADGLLADASNLALVLHAIRLDDDARPAMLAGIQQLYDGIADIDVKIQGGAVELFLSEGKGRKIPASRLSDGTIRWLALLAVLLHPEPPPLVCIEEPELGLHPDLLPGLARLLREASERMQLVVTTHSPALVDAFTDDPACVLVCERATDTTTIRRLDPERLVAWLELYSLGALWTKGELGGSRW